MKVTSSILLSTLCWSARLASAAKVHVYTFDSDAVEAGRSSGLFSNFVSSFKSKITHSADSVRDLSPQEARVVLAQRAGVDADSGEEQFFGSSEGSSRVVDAINDFGLGTPLFGEKELHSQIFLVEVDQETELSWEHGAHFTVSPAPSFLSAQKLLTKLDIGELRAAEAFETGKLAHWSTTKENLQQQWDDLLKNYVADPKRRQAFTVVVYGPSAMKGDADAAANEAWATTLKSGITYRKPVGSTSSPLRARQDDPQTSPLKGILPACFETQDQCESATRNCTGHGSCSLSYTDKTYENQRRCYSCSCTPTVSENSKGQKSTTYWGGPACQKRDVSMQFWLIALFSVGMVSLISFAVGNLWSMGEETLPSVIGAGVSGPVARR